VKVVLTPRARRRARAVSAWWRANRTTAPDLFERELVSILEVIAVEPRAARFYAKVGSQTIRRVLLEKTDQHVYFAVDERAESVLILTIWGARRRTGPQL
jgi:plasmid stabilization system protein ParE